MGIFNKIFGQTKKTEQEFEKVETMNPNDMWFTTSTISNEIPQTAPKTKETDFDIVIHDDDYRQNEFLNISSLPQIQVEFNAIQEIWANHSKKSEEYTLFKNCHVRKTIGLPNLTINLNELKVLLGCNSVGQVIINGEVLIDGFALETENTTYFGTLNGDKVIDFCIAEWNDNTRNEILEVNKAFSLLFVNWHHCNLIEND
jgi:hypothetical protein